MYVVSKKNYNNKNIAIIRLEIIYKKIFSKMFIDFELMSVF
jgi:hypothetical protein